MKPHDSDSDVDSLEVVSQEEVESTAFYWQRLSRGLYTKLAGQAIGAVFVAGVILSHYAQIKEILLPLGILLWIAVGVDVAGRVLCLLAARERHRRWSIAISVAAQAVCVVSAAGAIDWPFWQNFEKAVAVRAILVLAAALAQFTAAMAFTGFLRELARHLCKPRLEKAAKSMHYLLWISVLVSGIGLIVVVIAAVLVFLVFTILTFGYGWILAAFFGIATAVILSGPFLMALLAIIGVIQVRYAILVYRLAVLTSQEAKELKGSQA